MEYFADLHIHIGKALNKPVKITASRRLTLKEIFETCINKKGIDIVGVVDCASPLVLEEISNYMASGDLTELKGGGLSYKGKVTIVLGSEIETSEKNNVAHSIVFFPYFEQMKEFSKVLSKYITNINLSSQKACISAYELLNIAKNLGGDLIPAHIFTPFKSFYGSCYNRISEAFKDKINKVFSVELGLSADTDFADTIDELSAKTFISNSDAHSLEKIGREYNKLELKYPDYEHLFKALKRVDNENYVIANFGLNPKLGKYHRTRCLQCNYIAEEKPPITSCPNCRDSKIVLGVLDRITMIADKDKADHPKHRPLYCFQIPLEFIPGIGEKTLNKLIENFGTEMNVIHNSTYSELSQVVGEQISKNIILGRTGKLQLRPGGGGYYGKIISNKNKL